MRLHEVRRVRALPVCTVSLSRSAVDKESATPCSRLKGLYRWSSASRCRGLIP